MIKGVKGTSRGVHITDDDLADLLRFTGYVKNMHLASFHPIVVRLHEAVKFASESTTEEKEF